MVSYLSTLVTENAPSRSKSVVPRHIAWLLHVLSLIVLAGPLTVLASDVYKETEPNGTVTFSDTPSSAEVEPLDVDLTPNMVIPPPPKNMYSRPMQPTKASTKLYKTVKITSPMNDEVIRANDGSISVSVLVDPELRVSHNLVLRMDGTPVGEPQKGTTFLINNLYRGSHTFSLSVVDGSNKEVATGEAVTIHLKRASALQPNRTKSKDQ